MAQGNQFYSSGNIAADGTFTDGFNQTYSTEQYPIGSLRYQSADEVTGSDASLGGDRLWMFVKASSSGVSANDLLERDSTSTAFQVKTSSATAGIRRMLLVGVAQNAIAANEFGWVVVKGECVIKSDSVSAWWCLRCLRGPALSSFTVIHLGGVAFGSRPLRLLEALWTLR